MGTTSNKKGVTFVSKRVSEETKAKLEKLAEVKKDHINKLVDDYKAGKLSIQ